MWRGLDDQVNRRPATDAWKKRDAYAGVRLSGGLGVMQLQQLAKLINCEPCVAYNAAEREGIDWIMAGNGNDARAVRHDNMFALTDLMAKPRFSRARTASR